MNLSPIAFINKTFISQSRLLSCATSTSENSKTRTISFVTDIEGDALYFDRFVNTSKILTFEEVEPNFDPSADSYFPYKKRVIFKPEIGENEEKAKVDMKSSMLVCGGDMWDKGGNDLYVMRQMLSLEERYKGRVHFILGNRDINKMRIPQEIGIASTSYSKSLPFHGGVYWFKGTGLQGDPELIRSYLQETKVEEENKEIDNRSDILISNNAPERLRWILKKTMGSPDAFELRRNELKQEKEFLKSQKLGQVKKIKGNESDPTFVSDIEVVESYRESCHPTYGVMGKYLARSKLCLRIGCALFMHGSLPITTRVVSAYKTSLENRSTTSFWSWFYKYANPFLVGGSTFKEPTSTDEWINNLNTFANRQYDAWKQDISSLEKSVPIHGGDEHREYWCTAGGYQINFGSLCQYGMGWLPDKDQNPTVVYNSWLMDGLPRKFYDLSNDDVYYRRLVKDFFKRSGLHVIITGHQPGKIVSHLIALINFFIF